MQPVLNFQQIKILSDPRRLSILRRLMAVPATLTQLGEALGEHPAWVRHHLKALQGAGLVRLDHAEQSGGRTLKYYRASSAVLVIQSAILPEAPGKSFALMMGSHDLALESGMLAWIAHEIPDVELVSMPVGSLDGLVALRQGLCHLAACHLLDVDSDEYNLPYVRRLFPDREMLVYTLAERQQGLLVGYGNPCDLSSLVDVIERDVLFANRQAGSGTRIWLERQLAQLGVTGGAIQGYETGCSTHTEVALRIKSGLADCGIGLQAAAHQAGLDFIPLFHERFDLVLPKENASLPAVRILLDRVATADFRSHAESLGGYTTAHSGDKQSP